MTHTKLPRLVLALFGASLARAAIPEKLPALTFDNGRGAVELVERLRFENRSDNFDFDASAHSPTDDSWFVQRLRVGMTWKPDPIWSAQIQFQDAREFGSERPKVPFILGAEGNDAFDLRLAAITWGNAKTSPVQFTLGRQVLAFGDERLVGPGDWNNFARTFDAGKLVWTIVPNKTTATVFVSSVVNIEPTTSDAGWRFDRSDFNQDQFSGVYVSNQLAATDTLDGYVFWRDKKDNTPIYSAPSAPIPVPARTAAAYDIGQDIYTLGVRFVRAPKVGALDAEFEAAWQGGHVNRQTTAGTGQYAGSSAELKQDAWAVHSLVGFTPEGAPGKLRLDFEYNIASGDSHRTDDKNGSFMSLFPSTLKQYYSLMDVFAWKNLEEWTATARFSPLPKTTVRVDFHGFSLFTASDAWYRANGVATVRPLNAAAQHASRDAGTEFDVTYNWTPRPWAAFDLGWSRFNAGAYLKATGANSDADFYYVQTTLKF